jgi:hypothetical protein
MRREASGRSEAACAGTEEGRRQEDGWQATGPRGRKKERGGAGGRKIKRERLMRGGHDE